MKNILVLCHGNKFRSPACAAVLKSLGGLNVESAGFKYPNKPAAKKMRDAMFRLGFDLSEHRSQLVTTEMLQEADVIIYMDNGNYRRLFHMMPSVIKKSHCLAKYVNERRIPDPAFLSSKQSFDDVVDMIVRASKVLHLSIILDKV